MEETPKKVLQRDGWFMCSTAVQKKGKIYISLENVLSIFRRLLIPVWM